MDSVEDMWNSFYEAYLACPQTVTFSSDQILLDGMTHREIRESGDERLVLKYWICDGFGHRTLWESGYFNEIDDEELKERAIRIYRHEEALPTRKGGSGGDGE
jgi:hypothetical protein